MVTTTIRSSHLFKLSIYCVIYIGLFCTYPYVLCQFLPIPGPSIIIPVVLLLLFIIPKIFNKKLKPIPNNILYIIIVQSIIWSIFIYVHNDTTYFTRIVLLWTTYLSLLCLENCNGRLTNFFETYDKWIYYMAIGGMITFFIVLIFHISPLFTYVNHDLRIGYCYGLTCTNAKLANIIRYSGYFDEPGQIAFWGIWAIIFNHLFISNKRLELGLIITLIFTFSLAYYIQITLYLIFFKIKKLSNILTFCTIIAILYIGISSTKDTDFDLYKITLYRFEKNDSGNYNGDNRSELVKKAKKVFLRSPLWGNGAEYLFKNSNTIGGVGDNPLATLAYDGIIGTINIYLPLIFLIIISRKRLDILKAIIILVVGYLQRPFTPTFISGFILYSFVTLCYSHIYNK